MAVVTKDQPPVRRRRRRYPKEFQKDVCALVLGQRRSVADVANELGLVEQTVYNCARQERVDRGEREGPEQRRERRWPRTRAGR